MRVVRMQQMVPSSILVMPAKAGIRGNQSLIPGFGPSLFAEATKLGDVNHLFGSHH